MSRATPLPTSQSVAGRGADPDDYQIGVQFGPVGQHDAAHGVVAADLGHADARADVGPLGAVQSGDQLPDPLAEDRRQRGRLRFDQNHLDPEAAQARRDLTADEARSDHHRAAG